jgi:hypothetical protein
MVQENTPQIFEGKDCWNLLEAGLPELQPWGSELLKSGLEPFVNTIVVEPRYICKDHRNLHSNFYSKKFTERSPLCKRLHFFSRTGISKSALLLDAESLSNDYIGYSVIRPVSKKCIGRTVIDQTKVGRAIKDGFFSLRTAFKTHVFGSSLSAYGYPYMSQDGEAMVCAHTALWGVCRFLSERYSSYQELYPYDLVTLTNDAQGRRVPYRGMRYSDYSSILTAFGCHPEIIRLKERSTDPAIDLAQFRKFCAYVESGFPILASFTGHVVSVIGHTLDLGKTVGADADGLIDSSQFLKQLIVVDDNFFPYQLLGWNGDKENYGFKYAKNPYTLNSIAVAVCPLPEKVYLPAEKAAIQFKAALNRLREKPVLEKLIFAGTAGPLVTRMFIATSTSFIRRRLEKAVVNNKLVDSLAVKAATFHLPHFVWVMEIAPLEMYKAGKCTAEIVLDATANANEKFILYARVGQNLLLKGLDVNVIDGVSLENIFEQYTHNLGER